VAKRGGFSPLGGRETGEKSGLAGNQGIKGDTGGSIEHCGGNTRLGDGPRGTASHHRGTTLSTGGQPLPHRVSPVTGGLPPGKPAQHRIVWLSCGGIPAVPLRRLHKKGNFHRFSTFFTFPLDKKTGIWYKGSMKLRNERRLSRAVAGFGEKQQKVS
jgi:hypothetical protein